MCTAISVNGKKHLFGRTLDLENSFGEQVVTTPAGYTLFGSRTKYSIIGTAAVRQGTPLYFDGMNECGLCAAALNYPRFAVYGSPKIGKKNIPSYELLPYILGNCSTAEEARRLLLKVNVTGEAFCAELEPTPLHWFISDKENAICAEPDGDGLSVYDDPFRALTNSPPFPYHYARVSEYMGLSAEPPQNAICKSAELIPFSRGLGAVGLPGDYSSPSRFVRAVFALENTEKESIGDFFHILDTVAVPSGAVIAENGKAVRTVYTCCADTDELIYYFTTYECRRIRGVRLKNTDGNLSSIPMTSTEDLLFF